MTVRHFLRDDDLSPQEQQAVLDLADELKKDPLGHKPAGRSEERRGAVREELHPYAMSFDVGIAQLGGHTRSSWTAG